MKKKLIAVCAVAALCAVAVNARTIRQTFGFQDADNNVVFQKTGLTSETTGQHEQSEVLTVATSETAFAVASGIVGGNGPGLFTFYNEDSTNEVEFGTTSGDYSYDVPAGKGGQGWLNSTVTQLYFKSSASNILFRVHIFER